MTLREMLVSLMIQQKVNPTVATPMDVINRLATIPPSLLDCTIAVNAEVNGYGGIVTPNHVEIERDGIIWLEEVSEE